MCFFFQMFFSPHKSYLDSLRFWILGVLLYIQIQLQKKITGKNLTVKYFIQLFTTAMVNK